MKPTTILHVIEGLGRGGAERRLLYDVTFLDRSRFRSVVCHLCPPCEFTEKFSALDIPLFCLEMNGWGSWGQALARLSGLVRRESVDLIHTQLFWADLVGRMVGKWKGLPVVTTLQSSVYEPGIDFFHSPKRRWLESLSGRLCNEKFVAVSDFVRESAITRLGFPREDVVVIRNGVDFNEFLPPSIEKRRLNRASLGISDDNQVLITVGKLNPPKGMEDLIKALPKIVARYPKTILLIVGEGPMRAELEELSLSSGSKESIRFLGHRADVPRLLAASDLFVLPTLSEGFPLSLLEAVATGLPCVASDIGPIRELLGEMEPSLIPTRNPQALSEAVLKHLCALDQSRHLAREQRISFETRFDARKSAVQLEHLYDSLLREKGRTVS